MKDGKGLTALDRIFLFCVYAPVFPIMLFLAGWWGSIPLVPENRIFIYAFLGLALGIGADLVVLGRWLKAGYRIGMVARIAVYLFYMVGVWGFFMGVPVFNVLVGAAAGIFVSRGMTMDGAGKRAIRKALGRTAIFATAVMLLVCIASAAIAFLSSSTPSDLSGMSGLRITPAIVRLIILVGGVFLLVAQYWLTVIAGTLAVRSGGTPY